MLKLTASNIVAAIAHLPRNRSYQYINLRTKGQIEIVGIVNPEGPISIKRFDPSRGGSSTTAEAESISTQMIWRIANSFVPNQPINFDRVLGASYNTRSVLETLLVHTPQFYTCVPGRIENTNSSSQIRRGHKHVIWCPDEPHQNGIISSKETNIRISEMSVIDAYYDALSIPDDLLSGTIDSGLQRRHAEIQVALVMIGQQLGYRTWVAQNDRGIIYNNRTIGEMEGVIATLDHGVMVAGFDEAIRAARLIDCVWFKNGRLMPAVMEIEHTTGVTSGLTRMKGLQDTLPPFLTRYVIVAPDEEREKVVREINRPQFRSLNARYFTYSSVEELYALCQRRKIQGVTEEFLDCYMESVLEAS